MAEDRKETERKAKEFEKNSSAAAKKMQKDWEKRNPNA